VTLLSARRHHNIGAMELLAFEGHEGNLVGTHRHLDGVREATALDGASRHVDPDHDIGTKGPSRLNRDRAGVATIDQPASTDFYGREDAGDCRRCRDGARDSALRDDDLTAFFQVDGDGGERNAGLLERSIAEHVIEQSEYLFAVDDRLSR